MRLRSCVFASAWYRFDVVVSALLLCILVSLMQYDAAPLAIALEKSVRLGQRVSIVLHPMAPSVDSLGSSALFMIS